MDVQIFHKLLTSAIQKGASDIHLQVGYPPLMRVNGELLEVKYHPLNPEETHAIAEEILSSTYRREKLADLSEVDVSYGLEGQGRFRVNLFRQRGSLSVVLRVIPITIKSFKELNLPPVMEQIANLRRGLVLVVGATGNGKSTTLAAIIEHINETRRAHILTIEDPIEFLFKHKMSVISQRELGSDTPSFGQALHAVPPPGPRRDHDRRDAGRGDRGDRPQVRRDGPPRPLLAAHHRRREDHRPPHRVLPARPGGHRPRPPRGQPHGHRLAAPAAR